MRVTIKMLREQKNNVNPLEELLLNNILLTFITG